MSDTRSDIEKYAKRVQLDLLDCEKKLKRLMEMVFSLPIPEQDSDAPVCPDCGPLKSVRNARMLAEHRENVHGVRPVEHPERG